jgi:hypothetical protein
MNVWCCIDRTTGISHSNEIRRLLIRPITILTSFFILPFFSSLQQKNLIPCGIPLVSWPHAFSAQTSPLPAPERCRAPTQKRRRRWAMDRPQRRNPRIRPLKPPRPPGGRAFPPPPASRPVPEPSSPGPSRPPAPLLRFLHWVQISLEFLEARSRQKFPSCGSNWGLRGVEGSGNAAELTRGHDSNWIVEMLILRFFLQER